MFEVDAPDWAEHPVYASMLSDSERLRDLLDRGPAGRSSSDLAGIDIPALSSAERVDLLAVLAEQRNWLESLQLQVLAELQRTDRTKLGLSQEQVSLTLKVPLRTAQHQLATATALRELPKTAALLAAGQITGRHAQVLADAAATLSTELAGPLESRVVARAPDQTVPQFQQSVRRAAIALDPATAEQRRQRALADRCVRFRPREDGLAELSALLGAPEAQLIYTRLTAATGLLPTDDPRTLDQQRADLLVDGLLSGIPADALPDVRGRRPTIGVTVSADTLLQLNDEPAHLDGYGPITAEAARKLAADESGTWRRLLTDPDTGQLLDISQQRYRPSQRLRDYVTARDGVCCFPTCNQPGYRCDYDHIIPYRKGGQTCRCNGALACPRHNNCKINTGWSYTSNPDGSFSWTSDTGHSYTSHPPERWPMAADRVEPPTEQQVAEDAARQRLATTSQGELESASRSGEAPRISPAHQDIEAERQQRSRHVAHRADPDEPPF